MHIIVRSRNETRILLRLGLLDVDTTMAIIDFQEQGTGTKNAGRGDSMREIRGVGGKGEGRGGCSLLIAHCSLLTPSHPHSLTILSGS